MSVLPCSLLPFITTEPSGGSIDLTPINLIAGQTPNIHIIADGITNLSQFNSREGRLDQRWRIAQLKILLRAPTHDVDLTRFINQIGVIPQFFRLTLNGSLWKGIDRVQPGPLLRSDVWKLWIIITKNLSLGSWYVFFFPPNIALYLSRDNNFE